MLHCVCPLKQHEMKIIQKDACGWLPMSWLKCVSAFTPPVVYQGTGDGWWVGTGR